MYSEYRYSKEGTFSLAIFLKIRKAFTIRTGLYIYIYRVRLFDVKLEISLIWRGKRKKNLEERICDSLLLDTRQ